MELTLDQALQKGIEAHKADKAQEADQYYTAILKANPKHPDANHNMGVLAVGVGKVTEALPFFKTALDVNPKIDQYWLSYIDALIKLNLMYDAKAVFDQAKRNGAKGDSFDKLEERLGSTPSKNSDTQEPPQEQLQSLINLHTQGQYQRVLSGASQLLLEFPKSVILFNIIGATNKGLGKLEEAIEAYNKALSINPDYAEAHNNLGVALREQGKLDEAVEACTKAISINPDYADAYYNMGIALKEQGTLAEAIEAYNKAVSIKPDYADAYYNMGNALKEQGKLEETIEAYTKALSLKPAHAEAHNNIGVILQDQGKLDEAIEAYHKALSIKPDYAEVYYNMGLSLYGIAKFREAASFFRKNESIKSQTWLLKCLYGLNNKSHFYNQLDYLISAGESNAIIGSYTSRSKIRYGINRENPFCNEPLKYVLKIDLLKKCDFQEVFVKGAVKILNEGIVQKKKQHLVMKGNQTAGNVFGQMGQHRKKIQDLIVTELENYRFKYKNSNEGLIANWPTNYRLNGWIVKYKSGGAIKPHMHEKGWISGSIYINVPSELKDDSGNLVVCIESETDQDKQSKSINVVTGSLCLFPSSLLHYTIPFESNEDRTVLAFDMIPN